MRKPTSKVKVKKSTFTETILLLSVPLAVLFHFIFFHTFAIINSLQNTIPSTSTQKSDYFFYEKFLLLYKYNNACTFSRPYIYKKKIVPSLVFHVFMHKDKILLTRHPTVHGSNFVKYLSYRKLCLYAINIVAKT